MVRLTTCNSDFEAQLIKGLLESEGIMSMLTNENVTNLYAGIIASWTGIDIMVREEDLEQAKAILEKD